MRDGAGSDPGNEDTFVAFSIILGIMCAVVTFAILAFQGIGSRFDVGFTAMAALVPGLLLAGSVTCGLRASGRRRPRVAAILAVSIIGSVIFFVGLGAAAHARYERQYGAALTAPPGTPTGMDHGMRGASAAADR